jgi:hypothetical protein
MLPLLLRLASVVGTITTAGKVLATTDKLGTALTLGLWVLIGLTVIVAVADIHTFVRSQPKRYEPQSPNIHDYMCRWLNQGGNVAVFSRDLSWVIKDSEAYKVLSRKAAKGELVAFVANDSEVVRDLVVAGGKLISHPKGFTPKSRFTIIDYGKSGARVAIGRVEDSRHTIREFDGRDPTVLALADDLASLAMAAGRPLK